MYTSLLHPPIPLSSSSLSLALSFSFLSLPKIFVGHIDKSLLILRLGRPSTHYCSIFFMESVETPRGENCGISVNVSGWGLHPLKEGTALQSSTTP